MPRLLLCITDTKKWPTNVYYWSSSPKLSIPFCTHASVHLNLNLMVFCSLATRYCSNKHDSGNHPAVMGTGASFLLKLPDRDLPLLEKGPRHPALTDHENGGDNTRMWAQLIAAGPVRKGALAQ